jgi:coenzyme A diphosphatase NUDT7
VAGDGSCSPYRQSVPRPPGVVGSTPARRTAGAFGAGQQISLSSLRMGLSVPRGPLLGDPVVGGPVAAVMALTFEEPQGVVTVLIRRGQSLRVGPGEIAFPGGRIDPGETPRAAALRELEEELGVPSASVEVIGRLGPVGGRFPGGSVVAFVGLLEERPSVIANPAEVDGVLFVPLGDLVRPGTYHEEQWPLPGRSGESRSMHFFGLGEDLVWGLTAELLHELLHIGLDGPRRQEG